MSTRTSERRLPERRPRRNPWRSLRSLLLLVLLVEVVLALRFSPAFAIREVRVEGIHLTSPAQVVQAARIADGSNWVILHRSEIARRLERLPTVEEAVVSYGMIGRVTVKVFERQPVAVLCTPAGVYWVDARGIPFWQPKDTGALPRIRVQTSLPVGMGRVVRDEGVQSALEILCRYLPEYPLPIAEITVDPDGNLCLNMKGRFPQVRIGDGTALSEKIMRIAQLWSQPQLVQHAEYFDVSCIDKPVWKPRGSAKEAH